MEWQYPYKVENIRIFDINVYPGQALTVWMNKHGEIKEREAIQVEMRVTLEGRIEIFTDLPKIQIKHFSEWTDIPKANL